MRRQKNRPTGYLHEALESRRLLSTVSWVATSSGSWNNASNWSGDAVPGAGDDVVIAQAPSVQVTLSGNSSVKSLTLANDTLTIESGSTLTGGNYNGAAGSNLNLSAGTVGSGIGTNLLSNTGFESPAADGSANTVPDSWGQWGDSYVSTQVNHSGSQSLLMYNSNSGVYETFSAEAGVSYSALVYALNPSANPLTGGQEGFMHFSIYNSSGGELTDPAGVTAAHAGSTTDTWLNASTSFVAPAGTASIEIFLQVGPYYGGTNTGGGYIYWDDVQFGPTTIATAAANFSSISNGGTIAIGAAATIDDTGTFTQSTTGTLITQVGPDYGSLNVTGAAMLAGAFKATIASGYAPSINDGFNLINYGSETGSFASDQLPSGSNYQFQPGLNPTYFGISAVPLTVTTTINAATKIANSNANLVGVNLAYWDDLLTTTQTQQMVEAGGFSVFRFPGGSASDEYHFNVAENFGDPSANTIPQFAQFISQVGGTGIVTVDYGSGSPQEAEAELAYLEGSTSDTTNIGTGPEWNGSAWQNVSWQTVQYWAALRGAKPLATDDGLNFLRINQPAPFSDVNDWEIGNELYGSWEVDHHTAQHDPATYATFAAAFAQFVADDSQLPRVQIGIDSGDPTGDGDNNWTRSVITDLYADGYVPGFISDHSYMQSPGSESDSILLNGTVSNPASILDWSTRYGDYEAMLDSIVGTANAATVKIMATEFNSNPGTEGKQMTSLVNGLFIADSIGSLLDSGYVGGLVWDLRNGFNTTGNNSPSLFGWREGGDEGIIGTNSPNTPPMTGPYIPYPSYFGEQIASHIMQNGGQAVAVSSNYSELTVYSALEPNGHLDMMVLNKNPEASLTDQFDLTGFAPSGQAQYWQYGEAQDYAQSQSTTGAADLANSAFSLNLTGSAFSYTFPAYSMTVLDLAPFAAQVGSTVTVNLSGTAPVSINASGGNIVAAQSGDSLTFSAVSSIVINGSSSSDVLNVNGTLRAPFTFSNSGTTTLNVGGGAIALAAGTGSGIHVIPLYALNISAGVLVSLPSPVAESTRSLLDLQNLNLAGSIGNWSGKLDMSANDLEVVNGNIATINNQVKQGYSSGNGIISSAATGSLNHLTTLGTILNSVDGSTTGAALFNSGKPFDTTSPPATAVLVKYTYYGDTNLDGKVDGSDYARIDSNPLSQLTGWFNGDLNYDGAVNGSDYTLMDNAFNMQGAVLTANSAATVQAQHLCRLSCNSIAFSTQALILVDGSTQSSIELSMQQQDVLDKL